MREVVFAVSGDVSAPTGGYAYARRLLQLLPGEGVAVRYLALPGSFPSPTPADLAETDRRFRATGRDCILLIDGLAYGAVPAEHLDGLGRKIVALVHHPLHIESGLSDERRAAMFACERAALAKADRVIATSRATAEQLAADFSLPMTRITVAEPGTEPRQRARGTGQPIELLAVGAVSGRKNYEALVGALRGLVHLDWRLTIVGALDRSPEAVHNLQKAIAASGLGGRVTLAGQVEDRDLVECYDRADVFVSPSLFEGYGMALADAMAHGLPVIASVGGAAGETVPDGTGLKVPPGDMAAFGEALRRVIPDESLRQRLAEASWAAGQRLPRWRDTAERVAEVLRAVGA